MLLHRWLIAGLVVGLVAVGLMGIVVAVGWAYFHPRFDWRRGIAYGERQGETLTLDVLTPSAPNGLGIVFLVSGGWKSGTGSFRPWLMAPLLRHGYTVLPVYHVSQPTATVDEIFADVSRAVRFIRGHAVELGIDPDRLGVSGGSAGGHLGLMLATTGGAGPADTNDPIADTSSAVQAAAVFCPVTDLTNLRGSTEDTGDGGPPRSFLRAFDQDPVDMPRWRLTAAELSPLLHVTGEMPPVLIHHGDRDTLVPLDQSVRFRDRAAAVGGDVTLVTVAGAGHTWLLMPWHISQCAAWFDTQLVAPGRNRP